MEEPIRISLSIPSGANDSGVSVKQGRAEIQLTKRDLGFLANLWSLMSLTEKENEFENAQQQSAEPVFIAPAVPAAILNAFADPS